MTSADHLHEWYVACLGCDAEPDVSGHFVTFTTTGWSVEHSLQCRMDGDMQRGCAFESAIRRVCEPVDFHQRQDHLFGRWRITSIDSEGLPSLERAPADA
jgi:hypothetical protein